LEAADKAGLVREIRITRGEGWGADLAATLAPAALYYTSDDAFEEALRRMPPGAMRARFERLETLLATPGGVAAAAAEEAATDPLGIRELVARGGPLASLAASPTNG